MAKQLVRAITMFIAMIATGTAHAIPIRFVLEGVVDLAEHGNEFGLEVGDSIYGTVSVEGTGVGVETFTPLEGLVLSFDVGHVNFTTEHDAFFPFFPSLTLIDGEIDFLDFAAFDDAGSSFSTSFIYPAWDAVDDNGLFASGTFAVTSVPEPGALALFMLGLTGLALKRRSA